MRDGDEAVLVVLALPPERIAKEERRLGESTALNVKVIDPATHESMLRLAEAGLIALPGGELREVWPDSGAERSESDGRLLRAKALTDRAEHKLKAAVLLVGGGFAEEARVPAVEAARLAVAALAAMRAKLEPGDAESAAEFLLGEEPEGIPGGPPHDAIRALSGDEPQDGRSGTDRGVRVPHFLDGRGHVRSIAPHGGVAASAGGRFMCPGILPATGWMAQGTFAPSAFVDHLTQRVLGLHTTAMAQALSDTAANVLSVRVDIDDAYHEAVQAVCLQRGIAP